MEMKTIAIITLMIMLHYDVKIMINIMKCAPSKRHSLVSVGKKNKKTKKQKTWYINYARKKYQSSLIAYVHNMSKT